MCNSNVLRSIKNNDDNADESICQIIIEFSKESQLEKNELIDLLLNKSKRNYQSYGMIEGFIDDVINNQYMKEDLKQYLKEEHNIDLFIDNKEKEKLMKLLDLNINRHRNQISKSVVKKYI